LLSHSLEFYESENCESAKDIISNFVLGPKENSLEILDKILTEKLFQNVPTMELKKYYLGHMTRQLLDTVVGRRNQDDRDHYGKKRVETAGNLINNLFKSVWKKVLRDVKNQLEKKREESL